jgi:hypothetical protein
VGLDADAAKDVGQVAGGATAVGLVLGTPAAAGVLIAKGAGELTSAAIGEIFGEEAEKDVRNAVSQLDPLKTGTVANDVVTFVGGLFGGGGPSAQDLAERKAAEEQVLQVLEERGTTAAQALQQASQAPAAKVGGLLGLGRAAAEAVAPPPPPSPPPPPAPPVLSLTRALDVARAIAPPPPAAPPAPPPPIKLPKLLRLPGKTIAKFLP